jgi:hypothetical protein
LSLSQPAASARDCVSRFTQGCRKSLADASGCDFKAWKQPEVNLGLFLRGQEAGQPPALKTRMEPKPPRKSEHSADNWTPTEQAIERPPTHDSHSQLIVRLDNRVRCDCQLLSQSPEAGQFLSRLQLPGRNQTPDLIADLPIKRRTVMRLYFNTRARLLRLNQAMHTVRQYSGS